MPPDLLRSLLRARSSSLADVEQEPPERVLVRSDLTGTMQLYELMDSELVQVTALPEPIGTAHYRPGARQAIVAVDAGGNERHQLYLLELDAGAPASVLDDLRPITAQPEAVHEFAGVSRDGRLLAYVSNRGNGVDFDLWLCDLTTNEHRLLLAAGAWLQPGSGFSPDGRLVSVLAPGERPLDNDLLLVEVSTGRPQTVLAHPGEPAVVGAPVWVSPTILYAAGNAGRDFSAIIRHDLQAAGNDLLLPGTGERFDAEVSGNEHALVVIENREGASAIELRDSVTGESGLGTVNLGEPGVVSSYAIPPPQLSCDGRRLYYTLSTPRLPGDVFVHDADTDTDTRLTHSPAELEPSELVAPSAHTIPSFDGTQIPLFVFEPRAAPGATPPVVVMIHGGPEAQAMLTFNPIVQALALSGYGVVVPNVRGSTGYGKRYAALDDTTKRLDSVEDLRAIHQALGRFGFDPAKAALWGGSYGGYMVLAGLALQPELWAAGVDIVGVSNLVTFLQNTSDYRRAHREREYGSLTRDREFLEAASPLTHVGQIRAPLFVIHGRNDPRVPVTEAEQLVDNLTRRGIRTTLCIYEDEGHGLARLENRLDAYPRAVAFLDEVLSPGA